MNMANTDFKNADCILQINMFKQQRSALRISQKKLGFLNPSLILVRKLCAFNHFAFQIPSLKNIISLLFQSLHKVALQSLKSYSQMRRSYQVALESIIFAQVPLPEWFYSQQYIAYRFHHIWHDLK